MVTKRSIDALEEISTQRSSARDRKRSRISALDARSNSSVASSEPLSEPSAMQSTPPLDRHLEQSSASSVPSQGQDESEPSASSTSSPSASESSSEDGEDDSMEEEVVTVGGPKKPRINPKILSNAQDLQARLKSFLPQLQQANTELAAKGPGLSMEDVEDDEQHIEMNLGLGVLETKGAGAEPGDVVLPRKGQHEEDESKNANEEPADPIMLHLETLRQKMGRKSVEVVSDKLNLDPDAAHSKAPPHE
ncbi:unnamed protein product [Zymoseptoria tritici ST99CH_1A5]|uniref:Uncharacterized protein n=3 Tax=Zymoseptoria tritici TaxID=1047171 RepID=A0A1X7RKT4_ZYMT9|nr:unnamed protein product [Zymoseptoria tritici ST99CH_3D7]SMR46146.1 unnamed protein product [Zymoseptoria tritici ST99CH_1E4]SMR47398.1 unnamed protein product [Zymoseptoria tritici ST99CH_3D1]SMY21297.1 unnamed protein product [Zymoseptoria tritici ST99CH_1A5]